MRAPTFRFKLILAMMAVVVGVTVTTMFVTERHVQASYERLLSERFTAQVGSFTKLQESQLGFVKGRCRELVGSVRLREALRVAVLEGEIDLLYQTAEDELRDLRQETPGRPGLTFFRFFDAEGKVVGAAGERAGDLALDEGLLAGEDQALGFIAWSGADGRAELQEAIVTPIVDAVGGQPLGALMLAFPIPELRQTTGARPAGGPHEADHMSMLGLWFGGKLYPRPGALAPEEAARLGARLGEEMVHPGGRPVELVETLGGIPYRIFHRAPETAARLPMAYQVSGFSLADAYRDRRELRLRVLAFATLGLVGAFALSAVLSHGLAGPVRELVAGTGEIGRGNFDVKVEVRSRDELGQLAGAFNEMAQGLALKEKYRSVLNVVADERIAEELLAGKLLLGGELRDVSVLFCDIRGFTALTQNMPPGEVIDLLNEHMTALTGVVKQRGGVVDKFVGDLIMAVFGAPVRQGDDALSAARCALGMIAERERLNRTSRHTIRMGIGIATGEAVAGCMGSVDRLNYTVLGERVNLASRLCSKAGPMQVVIDETTRRRLADAAEVVELAPLELKGFDGRIPAFQLVAIASEARV